MQRRKLHLYTLLIAYWPVALVAAEPKSPNPRYVFDGAGEVAKAQGNSNLLREVLKRSSKEYTALYRDQVAKDYPMVAVALSSEFVEQISAEIDRMPPSSLEDKVRAVPTGIKRKIEFLAEKIKQGRTKGLSDSADLTALKNEMASLREEIADLRAEMNSPFAPTVSLSLRTIVGIGLGLSAVGIFVAFRKRKSE